MTHRNRPGQTEAGPAPHGGALVGLACVRCGAAYGVVDLFTGCPRCLADGHPSNVAPVYRLDVVQWTREALGHRPATMWRYRELLPVRDPVTLGEGGTPLLPLPRLGRAWGIDHLYLKDESRNPTGSFKDRLAAVVVARAREVGAGVVAIASSGNAGAALAAYAARAGLRCVVLTAAGASAPLVTQMLALGACLVATPTARDRWTLLRQGVEALGWYPAGNFHDPPVGSNPYGIDGYKTIAFEILADLAWTVPGLVALPVCYGDGLWGVARGFREARRLGLVDGEPRLVAGEVFGPLARALAEGLDHVPEVPAGPSVAFSIAAGISTYQALRALREGGEACVLDDGELLEAQAALGTAEGIFVEASAAAGLAAVRRLAAQRRLPRGAPVVVVATAGGLKDVEAARSRRPPVPVVEPTLAALREALRQTYGMAT
ncbi:MAG: pyridoxal-phosphate dependent enzyme [Armatimonadota bacterium]|nr:pyridoxal-phosphate dependent enzyme [Armatimonadota bacterium]MDR7592876.1 pyridoxal-phosphate dependent enzyme [Armatimonadota bacterium]